MHRAAGVGRTRMRLFAVEPGSRLAFPGFIADFPHPNRKGLNSMDFFSSWPVMIGMAVALLALVGVMIFLRIKPKDEE